MKIVAVVQARMGSARLPGKVLKKIVGIPAIEILLARLSRSELISEICVATSHKIENDQLSSAIQEIGYRVIRGSETDVLQRFWDAAEATSADIVVRITGDCPVVDQELVDKLIGFILKNKCDYVSNILVPNYPDGQDIEVFKFEALKRAHEKAELNLDREHVTSYIENNSTFRGIETFKSKMYPSIVKYENVRMTIDHKDEYKAINFIISKLGINKNWVTYSEFITNNPQMFSNQNYIRNESYIKSVKDQNYG